MTNMLSIEQIIEKARESGIDFGKGDPYNRLRYYTKIGWLPHMTRQKDSEGNIRGHYPEWVVNQLITIEKLKESGASNEEIASNIEKKNKYTSILNIIKSKEIRTQIISYSSLLVLLLILANESGIVNLSGNKTPLLEAYSTQKVDSNNLQIVASGSTYLPKGHSSVFVKNTAVKPESKIHVTFTQNFGPASTYWISKVRAGEGFELTLDTPLYYDVTFNWLVTQ